MSAATDLPPATNDPLADAYARWRALVESELKGVPFDKKLVTRTFEGVALQPLYTRASLGGVSDLTSKPGEAPFLRGTRPLGYRSSRWEVAQRLAAATPVEFNTAVVPDLMHGQNAVVLTPDRATRLGLDPDEAPAASVGAGGISLADVEDLATALNGVELSAVPLHLDAGGDALPLAALFLETMRRRGAPWGALSGSIVADPIGAWISCGALPAAIDPLFSSLAGWTAWSETSLPKVKTVGVDVTGWSDAGATATQELAFALATATAYLRALGERGVPASVAARRFAFTLAIGPQFFTEIAKFRAFRPLWARVLTAFELAPEAAAEASVSAITGSWNKTLLDPHVNMLRVTTEALSAVLGGCDRLHIAPFDEVSGATTEFSRRIARNVHTLLAEEFNFAEVADAAGGSWYVEKLTDEIARGAWAIFQEIERKGGMVAALRSGYPQELAAKAGTEKRDAVAKRRYGLVGTNLFPNLKETPLARAEVDLAACQSRRAAEIRGRRGRGPANAPAHADWATRFALALSAAREGATVGQLSRFSCGGKPVAPAIPAVSPRRGAEDFETLRAASTAYAKAHGTRPKVFLAKMGPALQHKARADFSAGFFSAGGFEVLAKQSFNTPEEAAAAAAASKASVAVLCSTDDTYPVLVPAFATAVRKAAPDTTLVLAGLPADPATVAAFKTAGIDEFIHVRANVHDVLAGLLKKLGAL